MVTGGWVSILGTGLAGEGAVPMRTRGEGHIGTPGSMGNGLKGFVANFVIKCFLGMIKPTMKGSAGGNTHLFESVLGELTGFLGHLQPSPIQRAFETW